MNSAIFGQLIILNRIYPILSLSGVEGQKCLNLWPLPSVLHK